MGALRARERRLRRLVRPNRRARLAGLARLSAGRVHWRGRAPLLAVPAALCGALALYWFVLRTATAEPSLRPPHEVAVIGSGSDAVPVASDGAILRWLPAPAQHSLPTLPVPAPPPKRRLAGTLLEQVRVLAAAPKALRAHLAASRYGESGVAVEFGSGIEVRFGEASRAAEKWRAAAALLASPSVTALDYIDVEAPAHPSIAGSGHPLPPPS